MRDGITLPHQRLLTATEKVWRVVRDEILSLCNGYNAPTLVFEIYSRYLYRAGGVTPSKCVTHYGPPSCFPY